MYLLPIYSSWNDCELVPRKAIQMWHKNKCHFVVHASLLSSTGNDVYSRHSINIP